MLQIKNTLSGGKPEGLYAWKKSEIGSELKEFNKSVSTLPYNFSNGSAVVYNNEIHILGSYDSSSYTKHYKFDGSSWTSVSTLPYNFYQGSAVVLNNEIYILGGRDNTTKHYKWDGTSWTSVSTLPYNFVNGSAVVYNNRIHILGSENSSYYKDHYLIIGYVPVYTFLDYIVSDKETAYPDGGEKDGYYYERVGEGITPITPEMFGCTEMEIQEYIPTSTGYITGSSSHLWNHSLGVIPKVFMIIREEVSGEQRMLNFYIGGRVDGAYSSALFSNGTDKSYSYSSGNSYNCKMNATRVYLLPLKPSATYESRLEAGKKYRIIFMA